MMLIKLFFLLIALSVKHIYRSEIINPPLSLMQLNCNWSIISDIS